MKFLIAILFIIPFVVSAQVRQGDSAVKYRDSTIKYMRLSEKTKDTALARRYYDTSQVYYRRHEYYFQKQEADDDQKRRKKH